MNIHADPDLELPGRVLVIDDSRAQRRLLAAALRRSGVEVSESGDAREALAALRQDPSPPLVICDWEMPCLTGPEFCRALRKQQGGAYVYVILLTSRQGSENVAEGLEAGADDFLSKPVSPVELRARLRAGARVLRMEERLRRRNAELSRALAELEESHARIARDLAEARALQAALAPRGTRDIPGGRAALLLRPSEQVGGDLVGAVATGERSTAIFSLDVAGHGVTAALMAARLAAVLTVSDPVRNPILAHLLREGLGPGAPTRILAALDRQMQREMPGAPYLTMALALTDPGAGLCRIGVAGHPPPVVVPAGGGARLLETTGMPLGLVPEPEFGEATVSLEPGLRILLYSDGATEAEDPLGRQLGDGGLIRLVEEARDQAPDRLLESLARGVTTHTGRDSLQDDLSFALLETR